MTHDTSAGLTHPEESSAAVENQNNIKSTGRYHYMDNVRALAMFVGVLFHASLAYSPLLQNLWFTSSADT